MTIATSRKLQLSDISDLRAYERERPTLRDRMIQIRGVRRVSIGPLIAVAFESRDTVRYQIQEMARAERLSTDAEIQVELDTYNSLVPDVGQLSATVFLELTSNDDLRRWLPKLIGIENHIVIRFSNGTIARSVPESRHDSQLTRTDVTSAVHYVTFALSAGQVDAFALDGASLVIDHPEYLESVVMSTPTVDELLVDLKQ